MPWGFPQLGLGSQRAAGLVDVVDPEDEPDRAERRVDQLDVDAGLSDLARDLAHAAGPILDVHDEHVALVANLEPRVAQGAARGRFVLHQDVDGALSALLSAADALDVDAGVAGRLAEVGEPPGPILEPHRKVLHRMLLSLT